MEVHLESRIPELQGQTKGRAKQRTHLVALTALAHAKANAPEVTGEYKNGLGLVPTDNGEDLIAIAPHSIFVELGTVHMPAQHVVTNAIVFAAAQFELAFADFYER